MQRPRELEKRMAQRSEEHTSELQSQSNLVCRLLLEKKNLTKIPDFIPLEHTSPLVTCSVINQCFWLAAPAAPLSLHPRSRYVSPCLRCLYVATLGR